MSPLHWVATELGRFLGDGYREIRALIASNSLVAKVRSVGAFQQEALLGLVHY